MNRNLKLIPLFVGALGFAACVGEVPSAATPETEVDAGIVDESDGAVEAAELAVSGTVVDYFQANLTPTPVPVVADATLETDGLVPAVTSLSDALGSFTMDVLPASLFFVQVSAPGYAPARNAPTQILDAPLSQDQYAASELGIARQYTGAGGLEPIEPILGNGIIMIDLVRNNGEPAIDVPVENITIATAAAPDVPLPILAYLVDPLTTDLSPPDVTLLSALDANGKARAGFLNVPPGEYIISVTVPGGGGGGGGGGGDGGIQLVEAIAIADGATFVHSANQAGGGGGGGGGGQQAIILDPNAPLGFTEDIYPILMTVAEGGDGCATCHDALHILPFTGTPEETLALLNELAVDPAGQPRINLESPADSPFVTKPVYEPIPNHPNAFWTTNSNHYIGSVAWIAQGAALLRADAVLPPPPEE